jgi:hypothetical protein
MTSSSTRRELPTFCLNSRVALRAGTCPPWKFLNFLSQGSVQKITFGSEFAYGFCLAVTHAAFFDVSNEIVFSSDRISGEAPEECDLTDVRERIGDRALE